MDACVLQLGASVFRVVEYRVSERGDVEPVHLGNEPVALGESIEKTGRIGGGALVAALGAAARLVARARTAGKNLHVVVVASETIALARNADRFFAALKRRIGAAPRMVVPPGVFAAPCDLPGLADTPFLPHVSLNLTQPTT
jgi:exopolyphosphatase/pppGpp-phosphohydrolase